MKRNGVAKSNPISYLKRTVTVIKKRITSILLIVLSLFSAFITPLTVSASTVSGYTSALDDLQKDYTFNVNDYPSNPQSNDIQVIHIGESEDGELFIYTYQPGNATKHYKAKYINMSLQSVTDKDPSYALYSLTWLNSDGVFDKYIVNDFVVRGDVYRYYNIASIYRPYDETVDISSSSEAIDNVQCKAFKVAQLWCLYYYNNSLIYEMENIEVVEYTNWASGSVRYTEGFKLYLDSCDSHYVAFSIDNFNVDKIYDADITYTINKYSKASGLGLSGETELESSETVNKTLTEFDVGSNEGDGLFGVKYTWSRISSVEDFKEEVEKDSNDTFSAEELSGLSKSDFVFRFAETSYSTTVSQTTSVAFWSEVREISILRLHFLSQGKVYNLGCVGDLVGTDSNPELDVTVEDNFENQDWWQKIIAVLLLLLFVVVFFNIILPIVKPIFELAFKGLKYIVDAFLTIIVYPIQTLFKRNRK